MDYLASLILDYISKEVRNVSELKKAQEAAMRGEKLTQRQADLLARDAKVVGGDKSLEALKKAATADKVAKGWFGK